MTIHTFEITIPVLNEEETLKQNILYLYDFLKNTFSESMEWSVLIADNGSTDKTQSIAEELTKECGWLHYIRLDKRGVGLALKASWRQSNADIVGYLDLDLATDLKHLPEAILAISEKDYDMVYGTRLHRSAKVVGRSMKREFTSRVFNLLLKTYLGVNFSDGMCGFKFLKRSLFEDLFTSGAESDGWFFSTELLVISEWKKYKIYELPVEWTDTSDSKVKVGSLAIEYLKAMRILKKLKYERG